MFQFFALHVAKDERESGHASVVPFQPNLVRPRNKEKNFLSLPRTTAVFPAAHEKEKGSYAAFFEKVDWDKIFTLLLISTVFVLHRNSATSKTSPPPSNPMRELGTSPQPAKASPVF